MPSVQPLIRLALGQGVSEAGPTSGFTSVLEGQCPWPANGQPTASPQPASALNPFRICAGRNSMERDIVYVR